MNENIVTLGLVHQGRQGKFTLNFHEWEGSEIKISFADDLYRNSGVIKFDGASGNVTVTTNKPYAGPLSEIREFRQYFMSVVQLFANAYTYGWSPPPQRMISYDLSYHEKNEYVQGNPNEIKIKEVQAQIIRELANPVKCLIAGCSGGELVRQCRRSGMTGYGFDVLPHIEEMAFDEVKDFIKSGSLTEIPFSKDDGFDTLVAIDVLEHIPERDVPKMISEWVRIDVQKLVLLINLNQFFFPGHITLRSLEWWGKQWEDHFAPVRTAHKFPHLPSVYSNNGLYNQQWTVWERKR